MLTPHQLQTINAIVHNIETEEHVEQLATVDRQRRHAERIAGAAHTVLHMLRDDMRTNDRADYDALYASLEEATQQGARRHLEAATAMWRFAVVRP